MDEQEHNKELMSGHVRHVVTPELQRTGVVRPPDRRRFLTTGGALAVGGAAAYSIPVVAMATPCGGLSPCFGTEFNFPCDGADHIIVSDVGALSNAATLVTSGVKNTAPFTVVAQDSLGFDLPNSGLIAEPGGTVGLSAPGAAQYVIRTSFVPECSIFAAVRAAAPVVPLLDEQPKIDCGSGEAVYESFAKGNHIFRVKARTGRNNSSCKITITARRFNAAGVAQGTAATTTVQPSFTGQVAASLSQAQVNVGDILKFRVDCSGTSGSCRFSTALSFP